MAEQETNIQQALKNLLKDIEEFHESNEDLLQTERNSLTGYAQLHQEHQAPFTTEQLSERLERIIKELPPVYSQAMLEDNTLSELLHQTSRVVSALERFHDELINNKRSFRDIVMEGPENMAEVSLLESATLNLSPDELSHAIQEDLPASTMLGKIESSKLMKQNQSLLGIHHERVMALQKTQLEESAKVKATIKDHGKENLDALKEITPSKSHVDKLGRTPNSPKKEEENFDLPPLPSGKR